VSLEIPRSNFYFIESNFQDIIAEIREGVGGLVSDSRNTRKTIVFRDMSKMYCHEFLDRGKQYIELYWYDWYDNNKQLIMKFHAHYHEDGTPAKITQFDPYHIHVYSDTRMTNEKFRELILVLEFIRLRQASIQQ